MLILVEKDKLNSKSKNKEDDIEDDLYVRKIIGVLLDIENLNNELYNNNVLLVLKRVDEDFDVRIKFEKLKIFKSFKESIEKLYKYELDLIIVVGVRFVELIKEVVIKYFK